MRALPIRARLAAFCAAAVAVAIATASVVAWVATKHGLREQVDASLDERSGRTALLNRRSAAVPPLSVMLRRICEPPPDPTGSVAQSITQSLVNLQVVQADGTSCAAPGIDTVEPTAIDYAVAREERDPVIRDATTAQGEHVRAMTTSMGDGYAVLVTRSLAEVDSTLNRLALVLTVVTALGVIGAATAGLLVARAALRPVDHLTGAAERIAETEDFDVPIRARGTDEVARLAHAFNAMTGALSRSRQRQQQLVVDASHELRTPLTSLRTNVEWLMRTEQTARPLTAPRRRQLETSVLAQVDELSRLIGDLAAVARDDPVRRHQPVQLDETVLSAVERAQRRYPGRQLDVQLQPWTVDGDQAALERAALNILDNALKFSPPDTGVTVSLAGGRLRVADRGPGVAEGERHQVFERFWRAPSARELPGSGLGLAIVADTVADHGGSVFVEPRTGGGCAVGFVLPDHMEFSARA